MNQFWKKIILFFRKHLDSTRLKSSVTKTYLYSNEIINPRLSSPSKVIVPVVYEFTPEEALKLVNPSYIHIPQPHQYSYEGGKK